MPARHGKNPPPTRLPGLGDGFVVRGVRVRLAGRAGRFEDPQTIGNKAVSEAAAVLAGLGGLVVPHGLGGGAGRAQWSPGGGWSAELLVAVPASSDDPAGEVGPVIVGAVEGALPGVTVTVVGDIP